MKKLLTALLLGFTIAALAQPTKTEWTNFLTAYKADTTAKGIAIRQLQKDVAAIKVRIDSNVKADKALNTTVYRQGLTIDTIKMQIASIMKTVVVLDTSYFSYSSDGKVILNKSLISSINENFASDTSLLILYEDLSDRLIAIENKAPVGKADFDPVKQYFDKLKTAFGSLAK